MHAPENRRFIPVAEPELSGNELAYVTDCVRSGWISSIGEYVGRFERDFALFCGTRHGVATSNGTVALHLALEVLGIGPGDEVIVPAMTFVATPNAVSYTGATPVFADSEPVSWTMDPADVERRITPRTKAIIAVHLYGHPCEMDALHAIADGRGITVIEDAAEAHGALYRGRRVGGLAPIGVFSFYGNKVVTTGEGGMLTMDDDALAATARLLRDHAMSPTQRYWHDRIGYNYRITNVQAAIGVAQMERIETFIARKRAIAQRYNERLAGVAGLTLPREQPWATSVFWMYSLLVSEGGRLTRDDMMAALAQRGIDSRPFFTPMHLLPPYRTAGGGAGLGVAERLAREGMNIPSAVSLTEDELERVADAIVEIMR